LFVFFFFSSRRRHTRWPRDWSSDVCSSDLVVLSRWTRRPRQAGHPASGRHGRAECPADRRYSRIQQPNGDEEISTLQIGCNFYPDRKSVVEGKRIDVDERRSSKEKKKNVGR